ncbi:sterol desaturase family protein [Chitinophagales bacterium]|nr:sterol desaturase family protein [Chitinophagales bacterium]
MEDFLQFFETMPSWQKLGWIFICLSFNWILEAVKPLISNNYGKLRHIGTNMFFLVSDVVINALFGAATLGIFLWLSVNNFGLLNLVELPIIVELVIGVMALDLFAQYGIHYFLHNIPFLWKFHMIHHSDTHVDATTATRHHPGDYLTREIAALIAIVLFGIPFSYYIFYRILTVFFTFITHANIIVPQWLDRPLSWVFVTPNMHKLHHHYEAPWTDSNYGNVFSFWDRIFGTMVYDNPKKVIYGLDILDDTRDRDIMYQLKIPFDSSIKSAPKQD